MFGEVNLRADTLRDEWYLRCQLRIRPDDVQAVDIEKIHVLLNKYAAAGNGAMVYFCQSLLDLDGRRAAYVLADKCLLTGLIDGVVDPLQDGVFDALDPLFDIYEDNADVMPLVDQAAATFGDAAEAETAVITARLGANSSTPTADAAPGQ